MKMVIYIWHSHLVHTFPRSKSLWLLSSFLSPVSPLSPYTVRYTSESVPAPLQEEVERDCCTHQEAKAPQRLPIKQWMGLHHQGVDAGHHQGSGCMSCNNWHCECWFTPKAHRVSLV
jgi:hypothetical protein